MESQPASCSLERLNAKAGYTMMIRFLNCGAMRPYGTMPSFNVRRRGKPGRKAKIAALKKESLSVIARQSCTAPALLL